jgi:hypothetical protein
MEVEDREAAFEREYEEASETLGDALLLRLVVRE